jgi:5-methylcytosine-specific restriction protein A
MIDKFKYVLENFESNKNLKFGKANPIYDVLYKQIPNDISNKLNNIQRYKVEGSAGKGNWVDVPWVAIFDKLITESAQSGYYPVFLFKEDMSGFYLSLGIGITSVKIEYKKVKKITEVLRIQSFNMLARIPELPKGFYSSFDKPIKLTRLSKGGSLGVNYENGCVFSKFYSLKNLPNDIELFNDIKNICDVYENITYSTISESAEEVSEQFASFQNYTDIENLKAIKQHFRIERNRKLIQNVKKIKGYNCECCGMNFENIYGEIGKEFIEAHHKQPLHTLKGKIIELNAREDFFVLCSNCHKMIHKLDDPSNLDGLRLKMDSLRIPK